jgi:hypothetical protein
LTLTGVVVIALLFATATAVAEPVKIAFVAAETSESAMGPHNRAAWEAARTLGNATLLLTGAKATFTDTAGAEHALAEFNVVWYHQGDAIARTALYAGAPLAALRAYAEKGGGVLLSGGALAMVAPLGLEVEMRP